ncbi:unnamed protein product [Schistosoma mattheei]|uniref:Uncharacterized protein n=1 Tax=Schistosoma mattheei TaxID=31246 RepID=A0A183P3C0_9TREM|nr:unnamed protein product [Schistosoma mattheei]
MFIVQTWQSTRLHPIQIYRHEIKKTCPKYNSTEVCQKAKSSNMKCIWCEKAKKCIESNDQGTHELKVNDCRIKKTPDVNDQTTSTSIILTEKTSMINETQVKQNLKATTKELDQHLNSVTNYQGDVYLNETFSNDEGEIVSINSEQFTERDINTEEHAYYNRLYDICHLAQPPHETTDADA